MSRRIASTERIGSLRVLEPRSTAIIRFGAVPGQRTNLGSCKCPDAFGLWSGVFNLASAFFARSMLHEVYDRRKVDDAQ